MFFKQEVVPTLCFYNVARGKEKCGRDGSYYNDEEVQESCFIIFHFAAIVMCVSLLSPCSLNVADGLQRSFVGLLYVPASRIYFPLRYLSLLVRFLTVFLLLAFFVLFLFFFVFFHVFFILHFIHHLIYECFYFTEFCSLVVGEICCLSYWTPPGVWCGTGTNRYVMNIFKTICKAVLPLTCLAYNLADVCDHWWYHTNVFTTLFVPAKFLTLFKNVGYYSHIARRLIAGAEWY